MRPRLTTPLPSLRLASQEEKKIVRKDARIGRSMSIVEAPSNSAGLQSLGSQGDAQAQRRKKLLKWRDSMIEAQLVRLID